MAWLRSWEVGLGGLLVVASPWLLGLPRPATLADAGLWFGCIVLGAGLLRDLWALCVTRPSHGEREAAMCVESIVGVATIACGLGLLFLPVSLPFRGSPAVLAGLSLIFAGWVHDLVLVRRVGRLQLVRDPDHGSFVVHFFRGQARVCALPPRASATEKSGDGVAEGP